MPEVAAGDDLAGLVLESLTAAGFSLADGDILVVTQKVVSKAEGRVVPEGPEGKAGWVARETRRVVARRGDLIIAETRHGLVCANAGVDASNVAEGFLSLLPEDPDASAEHLRSSAEAATGRKVGVVVTDTFGRPWRAGLVNVAIGCAGIPALVDLRGTPDALGRGLEVTVEALADEIAAAAGLVMGKAEGVPVAVVRGLRPDAPPLPASALVRPPREDLFRESSLEALYARRSARRFGPDAVPREVLEEAVRAACAAASPGRTRPWVFVVLDSGPARKRLLAATAEAWTRDPRTVADAPVLIVPCLSLDASDPAAHPAQRESMLLAGGAAIQNLMLALHASGLASTWTPSTLYCREEARQALGLGDEWIPLGVVAAGSPVEEAPSPRPPVDVSEHMLELE
jgi:coenzyme F420-0:L-glutamate ligase/coenzyme F420-1:gamma-L-glutamate ligase